MDEWRYCYAARGHDVAEIVEEECAPGLGARDEPRGSTAQTVASGETQVVRVPTQWAALAPNRQRVLCCFLDRIEVVDSKSVRSAPRPGSMPRTCGGR